MNERQEFFDATGKVAIGSRLRLLTDRITREDATIYAMYGVDIKPKWFPVFATLARQGDMSVTAIARYIGHTHPSVSNIVKEMIACKYAKESVDRNDRRRTLVSLTRKGREAAETLKEQCTDVDTAVKSICEDTSHDLWLAIGEWERLLSERSLCDRVRQARLERERHNIEIVDYKAEYRDVFRRLNQEWITAHWTLERSDTLVLSSPEEHIIARGGHISVALYRGEAVGVCALCKMQSPTYDYELAKYAVSPTVRGRGIGMALGTAVIDKARRLGARKLFLESNTILKPAIHIYRKLGFKELAEMHPAYARGDIQMELEL